MTPSKVEKYEKEIYQNKTGLSLIFDIIRNILCLKIVFVQFVKPKTKKQQKQISNNKNNKHSSSKSKKTYTQSQVCFIISQTIA